MVMYMYECVIYNTFNDQYMIKIILTSDQLLPVR